MSTAPHNPLISAEALRAKLADASCRAIDCRHDLADPHAGARAYANAHVPGALHAHLDDDLSGTKTGTNGRHPLPDRAALASTFARWGIAPGTLLVAYDAQGGSFAARLWWLARWLGHERVAVLDGGWPAWVAAGGAQETHVPAVAPVPPVEPGAPRMPTVAAADVLVASRAPQRVVVDARAAERYSGAQEPIDPVGGHIPGALNRPWQRNLDADGRFKPAARLREEFAVLLTGRQAAALVAHCGSGVTACHHLLAMAVAGLDGAALYPGSWSEWVADPERPVARGDAPG